MESVVRFQVNQEPVPSKHLLTTRVAVSARCPDVVCATDVTVDKLWTHSRTSSQLIKKREFFFLPPLPYLYDGLIKKLYVGVWNLPLT